VFAPVAALPALVSLALTIGVVPDKDLDQQDGKAWATLEHPAESSKKLCHRIGRIFLGWM
jgi:hypothetical protein